MDGKTVIHNIANGAHVSISISVSLSGIVPHAEQITVDNGTILLLSSRSQSSDSSCSKDDLLTAPPCVWSTVNKNRNCLDCRRSFWVSGAQRFLENQEEKINEK